MNKKEKKDKDEFPKSMGEEFRTVRFYTNINGVEKEYGYDYKRDDKGEEEYREIGEIPEELGKDFYDRIQNLERSFNWDSDFFTRSFERFSDIFPSFGKLMGEFRQPRLTEAKEEELEREVYENTEGYEAAYDLQVDKDNKELYLIVELPGFAKDQVNLKLIKEGLKIEADNGKNKVNTRIPIHYTIDRDTKISATMKHGILEVKLKLLDTENGEGTEIPIN